MNASDDGNDRTTAPNRRYGIDRRAGERRDGSRAPVAHAADVESIERRAAERRRGTRRAADVPSLYCPDCRGALQYEAGLSWTLPSSYTVDAGYCPACSRRFLRNRETGDYDVLSW